VTAVKSEPTSRLLRCSSAAKYLGISKQRIRELVAHGDLPHVQLGEGANSPFLLDVRDLDRLLEARKTRM
jgi:excisionase family DNA binding protein